MHIVTIHGLAPLAAHLLALLAVAGPAVLGMAKTLDPNAIATKWNQRASVAGPAYSAGVANPSKDWATATAQAQPAYEQGVQTAITRNSFANGAKKAGTAKWQSGATQKGAQRYPQGVSLAQGTYAAAITPYLQTLSSLTLPARGPSGSPQNYQISQAVGTALAAKKASIQSGGS